MGQQRGLITLSLIILLVTLPSAVSLTWYYVTDNPLIRPLSITKERLHAFFGNAGGGGVVAVVDWDDAHSGQVRRRDMQNALINAFGVKGIDVRVKFRSNRDGTGTFVTYRIGPSIIGPYPQSRAAEGISAAVAAYRMNVPFKP